MNFAVIGTGKTGSKVVELLEEDQLVGPFNSSSKPTAGKLRKADAAIIFVPATAVDDLHQPLLESGIPVVWATTGYEWPDALEEQLKEEQVKWLRAANFSLGMNIARRCLEVIGRSSSVLNKAAFHIHEVHHVHKQDAPSGTALSWEEWLGHNAEITSERKGDIKGIHELQVKTKTESLWLKHQAHDRKIFAEGAVWAAEQLVKPQFSPGFYTFSELFDKVMSNDE